MILLLYTWYIFIKKIQNKTSMIRNPNSQVATKNDCPSTKIKKWLTMHPNPTMDGLPFLCNAAQELAVIVNEFLGGHFYFSPLFSYPFIGEIISN